MRYITTICGLLALATGGAVQAQQFTFEAAANKPTTVGAPAPDGSPVQGAYWTGTSVVTWPDGKKTTDSYSCISTTQPRNAKIFDAHTICDAKGPAGGYSSVWGCTMIAAMPGSMSCIGGLTGTSGMYAGKGGTITFAGKEGSGRGTGQWGM